MPIWFALYRVFYNIPAYITSVKDKFVAVADEIVNVDGFADIMAKNPYPSLDALNLARRNDASLWFLIPLLRTKEGETRV